MKTVRVTIDTYNKIDQIRRLIQGDRIMSRTAVVDRAVAELFEHVSESRTSERLRRAAKLAG